MSEVFVLILTTLLIGQSLQLDVQVLRDMKQLYDLYKILNQDGGRTTSDVDVRNIEGVVHRQPAPTSSKYTF